MRPIRQIIPLLITLLALPMSPSCGIYTFSGISVDPSVKTVSVAYFENMAPIIMPTLSNTFTEALIEKFRRQTPFSFADSDGDLHFEGEITNYDVVSKAVQSDEMAALSTLTISIKVRFTNTKEEKQSFDRSFSASADFEATQSLDAVQDALVREIVDVLTENIFNAAVANW